MKNTTKKGAIVFFILIAVIFFLTGIFTTIYDIGTGLILAVIAILIAFVINRYDAWKNPRVDKIKTSKNKRKVSKKKNLLKRKKEDS